MASGSFYNYPVKEFGVYCEWSSTPDANNNQSTVVLKTYISYYTIDVSGGTWTTSINGVSKTFTSPAIYKGSASSWTKQLLNTRTETITHNSDGKKQITLSASYPFNGKYSGTSIGTITASKTVDLDNITNACTAPTTFTTTPSDIFENHIILNWSDASGGIGNSIVSYLIRYRTSSDNSTWGSWTDLITVTSASASGLKTIDMSSYVPIGHYVQFAIRTQPSNTNYVSDWKYSGVIRRKPYTVCTAPTTFTVTPNDFETSVTLSWSGASGGSYNSISSYYIQYRTSSDNSTWLGWVNLETINSTETSGSKTIDMSSAVSRGIYVQFRIQAQGSAGSSYYSSYKESNSIRRKPYTVCTAPTTFTLTAEADGTFEDGIVLSWSGASGGTNNSINGYEIQYVISSDNFTWGSWTSFTAYSTTNPNGGYVVLFSSYVPRGYYVKFRIRTQGTAGSSYYSDYRESNSIMRKPYTKCTAPTIITLTSEQGIDGNKYNDVFESEITIAWSGAKAGENNSIIGYFIQYRESNDGSVWGSWIDYRTTNETFHAYTTTSIANLISRGCYVQFRVKTLGAIDGYDSDYIITNAMRKNGIPSNISSVSINLPTLEYSYGDDVIVTWDKPSDIDNIYKYRVVAQPINDKKTALATDIIGVDNLTYIFGSDNVLYQYISNNEQIKFLVKAIDIFGIESNEFSESPIVTRYDITGVAIGINGTWVNCQLFVGNGRQWIEQDVLSGINNSWVEAYDGT